MSVREISEEEYRAEFMKENCASEKNINEKALERALDIRKFEIELYWKRASYFWTFIAATFAGFVAIQASLSPNRTDLSVLLCNLGIVFSFGWLCVNRGSKFWQENWENHVDMLEDPVHGPLYKVVLSRAQPSTILEWAEHILTGPSPISVSKINQLISLFITFTWIGLLIYALPTFNFDYSVNWYYTTLAGLTGITCLGFLSIGRTHKGAQLHHGKIRTSRIK